MYPLHVLYTIGHKLTGIGMYFNQAKLIRELLPFPKEEIHQLQLDWVDHLKKISKTFAQAVIDVNDLLAAMGKVERARPPQSPEDFVLWANENHQWLMKKLPEERASRAIYLYGFAMGEMMSTLSLCACTLDIAAQYDIPLEEQLDNSRNITLELLKRWDTLARGCAQIEEFSFLGSEFLQISSPIEAIFFASLVEKTSLQKSETAKLIRERIDQLGNMETNCLDALKGIDERFPIPPNEPVATDQ